MRISDWSSDVCSSDLLETAQFTAKEAGATLSVESINPNITDVTAPMLKIRAANPDVIILTTYARPATLIVKKAHELGMKMPIVLAVTGTARSEEHTSELQSLIRNS